MELAAGKAGAIDWLISWTYTFSHGPHLRGSRKSLEFGTRLHQKNNYIIISSQPFVEVEISEPVTRHLPRRV